MTGFADEEWQSLPPDGALAYARALDRSRRRTVTSNSAGAPGARASVAPVITTATPLWARPTLPRPTTATPPAWRISLRRTPLTALRSPAAAPIGLWRRALGSGRSDGFEAGLYGTTHLEPGLLFRCAGLRQPLVHDGPHRARCSTSRPASRPKLCGARRSRLPLRRAVTGFIIGVTPYAALQAQDFHTPATARPI